MRKVILSFIVFLSVIFAASGQYSSSWIVKAEPYYSGLLKINFNASFPPSQSVQTASPKLLQGFSCINDVNSNFFYTNGQSVYSGDGNPVINGDSLTVFFYSPIQNLFGHRIYQSNMFIPKPGAEDSLFIIFHLGRDSSIWASNFNIEQAVSLGLYFSVLNSNANNGKGELVLKSQMLIDDTLAAGKLSACKHANGRDWWVFARKNLEAVYYRVLVTPDTIKIEGTQSFSGVLSPLVYALAGAGNSIFTPDGLRFIQIESIGLPDTSRATIFNFDRCSGLFSNPVVIHILNSGYYYPLSYVVRGAVSPNSRYLYITTGYFIYQYDLTASNIAGSKQTVAIFDSTYCPINYPSPLYFGDMKLADDNRIYISSGGCYADVIHYPDSFATSCSLVVHNIQVVSPFNQLRFFPYHPDYSLGPLTGSPCDTLLGYQQQQLEAAGVTVTPNPGSGMFTLSTDAALLHDAGTVVKVYDLTGREVLRQSITAQVSYLDLRHQSNGIYLLRVIAKRKQISLKLVKQALD
jgi:hypothetical protein